MGVSLEPLGLTSNVVASYGFSYVTHNSSATYAHLGNITLPSSGIWVVSYQSRFGWSGHSAFHNVALSSTSGSAGIFTTARMVAERIGVQSSNANMPGNHMWYIDVHNGNSTKAVHVISYQSGGATSSFYQDDVNGQTGIIAWKLRESSTSGTGISNVGV